MVERKDIPNNLLGKDVTIKKTDNSFFRGLCVNQTKEGLMVNPKNRNGYGYEDIFVFVPYVIISEVRFKNDGEKAC